MAHPPLRAAQYVRMSTEHQRYSIEYQSVANVAFALKTGCEIVKTYSDAGISGLTLDRRFGLKTLLTDVLAGDPGFEVVLVYDVSRWGRFQDPDESAHYEYLCRSAGVEIRYTAEPFDNDGSLAASLVKHLKRAMAAEFSRELSARVSRTQRGLAAKGYWMGGPIAYGLRRQVIGPDGVVRALLGPGERTAIRGERVLLIPGPAHEIATVRRVFREYVDDRRSVREIVRRLNADEIPASQGARWTGVRARSLLRNEVYLGVNVLGKVRHTLGRRDRQPPETWVRAARSLPPIVSPKVFAAAQRRFRTHKPMVSDDELVAELKGAFRRHGRLSARIINNDPATHSISVYKDRFGNLSGAYARAGYAMSPQQASSSVAAFRDKPHRHRGAVGRRVSDEDALAAVRLALCAHGRLSREIIDQAPGMPSATALARRFGSFARLYAMVGYDPPAAQGAALQRRKRIGSAGDLRSADHR